MSEHMQEEERVIDFGTLDLQNDVASPDATWAIDFLAQVAEDMVTMLTAPFNVAAATARVQLDSLKVELKIEYPSKDMANVVKIALAVDGELQPDKVKREMCVEGNFLNIKFVANEARYLRASFSAFMDVLVLATRIVEEFGSKYRLARP
ncbi:hypothetical protein L7F22_057831 [Adiantum nelumboides]|nr:hypothetical protein [Adiantum nelumboides]